MMLNMCAGIHEQAHKLRAFGAALNDRNISKQLFQYLRARPLLAAKNAPDKRQIIWVILQSGVS